MNIVESFIHSKDELIILDISWLKTKTKININKSCVGDELCILNEPDKNTIEFSLWKLAQSWADYIFPGKQYKLCVTSSGATTPWATTWHTDDNLVTASMCIKGPSTQWKISNNTKIYDCPTYYTVIFKGKSTIKGNPLIHRAPLHGPRIRFQACIWDFDNTL